MFSRVLSLLAALILLLCAAAGADAGDRGRFGAS